MSKKTIIACSCILLCIAAGLVLPIFGLHVGVFHLPAYLSDTPFRGPIYWNSIPSYLLHVLLFTPLFAFPLLWAVLRLDRISRARSIDVPDFLKIPLSTCLPVAFMIAVICGWIAFVKQPDGEDQMIFLFVPLVFAYFAVLYALLSFGLVCLLAARHPMLKILGILLMPAMLLIF